MGFIDGIKKLLGMQTEPQALFRHSKMVRDSNGNVAIYFFLTNKKDVEKAQKILATYGIPVAPHKSSLDKFPVLKITWEQIEELDKTQTQWLMALHRTLEQKNSPSFFKSASRVRDRNGAGATYFFLTDESYAEPAMKMLMKRDIPTFPHRTSLNNSDTLVLKLPDDQAEKLNPAAKKYLTELMGQLLPKNQVTASHNR